MNIDVEKGIVEAIELKDLKTPEKPSDGSPIKITKTNTDVEKGVVETPETPSDGNPEKKPEEEIPPEPLHKRIWTTLTKGENLLVTLIVIFAIIGVVIGTQCSGASPTAVLLIKFPGEIFMRMLKSMIVPIIFTSIVVGLASINVSNLKRIGLHALTYFMSTTFIAVVLGIFLVLAIKPGQITNFEGENGELPTDRQVSTIDTFLDLIRNLVPGNLIATTFRGSKTELSYVNVTDDLNNTVIEAHRKLVKTDGPNTLGLISFAMFFGVMISSLGKDALTVRKFFVQANKIFMKIILKLLWFSPVGICSLIAGNLLEDGNLSEMLITLVYYILTVLSGLAIHSLIILPLIYFVITRKNPLNLFKAVIKALLFAFGTSSSSGTLPFSIDCLQKFGLNEEIINLVLPLGATMNMNGTALLEGVASITIAQMAGINLTFMQIVVVSITSTMASIGAAAIPSAGLVTLIMVLTSIGIPVDKVALLWTIDWILDRIRTVVNVFGDCVGAAIVHHLNKDHLIKPEVSDEDADEDTEKVTDEVAKDSV